MYTASNLVYIVPDFISIVVVIIATVTVFRITSRFSVIFKKGFSVIGTGMVFLSVATIIASTLDFSAFDGPLWEVFFDIAILCSSLLILRGVFLIHAAITGKQA